jgi:membrane dipeptidase
VARLPHTDHREDPAAWAAELGISREAVELYLDSDVIDLHIDSFIWQRVFGYDLTRRHASSLFGARFYGQVDLPRALEANLAGATWVITTNPTRDAESRRDTFLGNLRDIEELFATLNEQFQVVKTLAEYRAARAAGKHAVFFGIQGGNALDHDRFTLNLIDQRILRITLVHLSSSALGATSSPLRLGGDDGLSRRGREYVEQLNEKRIFVDLAHISRRGFWDAVEVQDRSQPLIVTHTGVCGVYEHWRNLDDRQLRAIADSGGTIGVMYHTAFLNPSSRRASAEDIALHLEHIVQTVGADHASLGSDWDGAIITPRDMPTCLELPRLVEILLRRGNKPDTIRKLLGANFLRVLGQLRGA